MISMDITRRQFLVGTGVAVTGAAIPGKQADAAGLDAPGLRTKGLKKTTTICPFCAVGCGATVHVKDGTIVNIEGDEASPINQGSLCSKGQALFQVANNDRRLRKVMYRAPGSRPVGREILGVGPRTDRPIDEGNARPDLRRQGDP